MSFYDGTGAEGLADPSVSMITWDMGGIGPLMDPIPPLDIFSLPKNIKITYRPSERHPHQDAMELFSAVFDWVEAADSRLRSATVSVAEDDSTHRYRIAPTSANAALP